MMIPLVNPHPSLSPKEISFRVSQAKLPRAYRRAVKRFAIKKPNPRRPPKEWFYRKLAEVERRGGYRDPKAIVGHIWYHRASKRRKAEILSEEGPRIMTRGNPEKIIGGHTFPRDYMRLRRLGYKMAWGGEGKALMVRKPGAKRRRFQAIKERPATRRGFHNPSKELSMVYSLIKRPRRRRASRRRRHNPRFGLHRPTLLWAGKWYRRKRSRLIKKGARINPRKQRSFRFRKYRRNPALPFDVINVAIGGAKIAGGIVVGAMLMPLVAKVTGANLTAKYGKFYGAIHVVFGAVLAAFIKNRMIKDAALVVAGTGVYDLIASNVTMLSLPTLPRSIPALGLGEEPGVVGMGASYQQVGADFAPALGASYQGADDISYGEDALEIG